MPLIVLIALIGNAFGQLSQPFSDCITLMFQGDVVVLATGEDCTKSQFSEAVDYYKANGYPVEDMYMHSGDDSKQMTLKSIEYDELTK